MNAFNFLTGSCGNHGYRSNGVYVDGWFGGVCGFGNPFFLMCQNCRDRYMLASGHNDQPSRSQTKPPTDKHAYSNVQAYNRAPDLLDIIDQGYGKLFTQILLVISFWTCENINTDLKKKSWQTLRPKICQNNITYKNNLWFTLRSFSLDVMSIIFSFFFTF